jgi:hypothetical protein
MRICPSLRLKAHSDHAFERGPGSRQDRRFPIANFDPVKF